MASDSLTFFAVNRCVYANSGSVIILFGLSPHNKKYTILESELHRNNVHLGDFLNACLINETTLKLFQKCSHPNDENVSVVQNEAYLRFPSAEATFDNNGSLIFNTRNFGPIVSSDQNLSPGRYDIVIKATGQLEKGDITLCADVIDEANFYEEPRSKLSRKGISRYPTIKSHRSNSPSDGAYEYIDVIYPGDQEYEHLEHFNTIPSNNLYGMRAADQLIENKNVTLPKLHPPAPLPRRLKPALSNPTETPTRTISTDSRDGYTIEQLIEKLPTLELEGIENSVPVPQKPSAQNLMKAFVHSVLQHPNQVKMHFIWICGLNKNAVLKLPMHDLELGHFFEGIFEEKPNGSWECTRHLREIEPLLNGIIVQNGKKEKVELISTITQYQPASISLKYAQGYVNHLGVVYDKNSRLNPDSNGRNVRIQKLKLDGIFEWVVTGFE